MDALSAATAGMMSAFNRLDQASYEVRTTNEVEDHVAAIEAAINFKTSLAAVESTNKIRGALLDIHV